LLIEQLTLTNILSFGPEPETVTFGPLTVLIGANGSGKSNLLEVIDLLRNAPDQLLKPIRKGGGIDEWRWKGAKEQSGDLSIEAVVHAFSNLSAMQLRYAVSIDGFLSRSMIVGERIEAAQSQIGQDNPFIYYRRNLDKTCLNVGGVMQAVDSESIDINRSILAQRRDPLNYLMITALAENLGRIRLYREWSFGRYTPPRLPQRADMPINWLEPDASNLGLVLNRLAGDPASKARILSALNELYDGIDDFGVDIVSNSVQVFLHEGQFKIPATRLSDGTLRFLCLLAILCDPNPPPLVCIEEPELGLHPDLIRTVAKLLQEASERCQLIVTTHSDILVDAMTATPEAIVVCEKHDGATKLHRLSSEEMAPWLEKYRLGELWTSGQIGGNRW
jgi:predicted ATPase